MGLVKFLFVVSMAALFILPNIFAEDLILTEKKAEIKTVIEQTLLEKIQQSPDEIRRVIITFHKKPGGYKNFVNSLGGRMTHDYDIIEGIAVSLPARLIERLLELENLVSIQEDREVHAFLSESVPLINADDIWALGYNGYGKTVCIVDTGVDDSHSALNSLVAEHCYCSKITGPGARKACCPNGEEEDTNAMDDDGHGTHVAGIVASNDGTYRGVAPGASLMAVKVLDSSGSGTMSDVIAGIDWCSAQNADVISLSLGGDVKYSNYCDGEADAQAVNNAVDAGSVVSIASGNDYWTDGISSPACASKVISVGSTTKSDTISSFTNRNSILDLLAPGGTSSGSGSCPTNNYICSTQLGGGFIGYSGTSMAAPMVAGAAALLLEANPSSTSAEIEAILKGTGVNIYDSGSGLTFPRIDVLAAITLPPMGHLEPYLIDPASDKNVIQNEFFNFTSGVKCLGGECGNISATLNPPKEISYDNGSAEGHIRYGPEAGGGLAVRFTPSSYPVTIKTARFHLSDTTHFELHVWDDDGSGGSPSSDLITAFEVTPTASGWYEINLSLYNIKIDSGDFYIGWIEFADGNYVGYENTPHDDRSWVYNGSSWALLSSYSGWETTDLIIRAKVSIISTTPGDKPFYTTSANPQICYNMQDGDNCSQTWEVNATGGLNTTCEFSTAYDSDLPYVNPAQTNRVNITIAETAEFIAEDIVPTTASVTINEFVSVTLSSTPVAFPDANPLETVNAGAGTGFPLTATIGSESNMNANVETRTNQTNFDGPGTLAVSNMEWSNAVTGPWIDYTTINENVCDGVPPGSVCNIYHRLTIPSTQPAGNYGVGITITASGS